MATVSPRKPRLRFKVRLPRRLKPIAPPYWARPKVLVSALGVIFVFWILPAVLGHTSLVTWVASRAAADVHGRIEVQSASLGWFSPITLYGVKIVDQDDRPVLEVPEVRGNRALVAMLWNTANLGRFHLQGPKFTVVLRENGSNVEDVFAKYLVAGKKKKIDVAVQIADGSVSIEDARTRQTWQIDKLDLDFAQPADRSRAMELKTSGTLADSRRGGSFELTMRVQQAGGNRAMIRPASAAKREDGAESPGPDSIDLKTEGLSLAVLEPVLRRAVPGLRLAGRLSVAAQCRWDRRRPENGAMLRANGGVEDLRLAGPMFGSDQPSLARLAIDGAMAWRDGLVQFDRVTTKSDVGTLSLSGAMDLRDPNGTVGRSANPSYERPAGLGPLSGGASPAARQGYEVSGQLDLVRLAAILPNTLRIQKNTRITSGQVQFALSNRPAREGTAWKGSLQVSNLAADHGGRPIVWRQPVQLTLAATETAQGPVIDTLQCESSFLRLEASGTPSQLTGTATFDAGKLAEKLRGFVDLGGMRLAGDGSARVNWKRTPDGAFDAGAEFHLNGFQWAVPDRPAWTEDTLVVSVSATGQWNSAGRSRLDTAVVKMQSGTDSLQARLMEPVADFRRGGPLPLEIHSQGQLARWPGRLALWFPLKNWSASGSHDLVAGVTISGTGIAIRQARFTADNLEIAGPQLVAREPRVEAQFTGRWDWASRRLEIDNATMSSATVAVEAIQFVCALPSQGPVQLAGTLVGQAALDRIRGWTAIDPQNPPAWSMAGRLIAKAEFEQSGGLITGHVEGQVLNLDVVRRSGQRYQEGEIRFVGQGNYNDASRLIHLDQAEFTSSTVSCTLAGQIANARSQPDLRINGQINYDMDRLTQLIRSVAGDGIRLGGRGSSPISYQGVWGSDTAVATAKLGWTWAQLYGFQLGAGELRATLSKGVLTVQPLTVACNEGRLSVTPQVDFARQPNMLTLAAGRVADQVRLTPALCASLLQYIAPLLAGVTAAEGRFSIDLDGFQVPLSNQAAAPGTVASAAPGTVASSPLRWPEAEIAGKLIVHSAEVSPGYLIRSLAQLLGRNNPVYLMRESTIPFRMTKGRIYHQPINLALGDLSVRSYGSVGLDESLDMMVEVPIPAKLQSGKLLGPAFKDQTIKLPVVGYLKQPRIDHRAFDQVAGQFLKSAAENTFKNRIGGELEKLFGPLKKR